MGLNLFENDAFLEKNNEKLNSYQPYRIKIYEEFYFDDVENKIENAFKQTVRTELNEVHYKLVDKPVSIYSVKADPNRPFPKV